jgi:hypothetical protein
MTSKEVTHNAEQEIAERIDAFVADTNQILMDGKADMIAMLRRNPDLDTAGITRMQAAIETMQNTVAEIFETPESGGA